MKSHSIHRFAIKKIAISVAFFCCFTQETLAEFYFPPSFISSDSESIADLSVFNVGGAQLPGVYEVEIWLNEKFVFTKLIRFVLVEKEHSKEKNSSEENATVQQTDGLQNDRNDIRDNSGLMACLSISMLREFQVDVKAFPDLDKLPVNQCISPGRFIPHAWTNFNFQKMRLDINIPQIAMIKKIRGYVPPELWDQGINAAMFSYNFSSYNKRKDGKTREERYLNLNSGINLGAWRLRDNRTWTESQRTEGERRIKHQHLNTYLERAIIPWRSQLTLGHGNAGGEVFSPLSFSGMKLETDDSMYPDSMRGFAPLIRGMANSNAQVSIKQNDYLVYRTTVPAGEFVIDDLYPMYSSGDLEVSVEEADGSTQSFTVPYSSVPTLLREGRAKYGVVVGNYRSNSQHYNAPFFAQGTLKWGLPQGITAYGGTQISRNYQAFSIGAGLNVGMLGAVSADITHANSTLSDNSHHKGQSLSLLYARSLNSIGTNFQLAGYRYSSRGFYTLSETALKNVRGWLTETDKLEEENGQTIQNPTTDYYDLSNNKRSRLQINISQRLWKLGSVYVTGIKESYWNTSNLTESLQLGFSSSVGRINYNISFNQNRSTHSPNTNKSMFVSISMPFGLGSSDNTDIHASFSNAWNQNYGSTQQLGLSGTLLKRKNLSWQLSQSYARSSDNSTNASLSYRGGYGNANVGYSYHSTGTQQTNYGISGSAVLHSEGLTFGQPLGDTNILVVAPGASNIPLENGGGLKTDWRGYTVKPNAIRYRENKVALDVRELDDRTEVENTVNRVVPTRGALVKTHFKTRQGLRVLMTLKHNGKPLPFGTSVTSDTNAAIVGDEGQVYLVGLNPNDELKAQWGKQHDQQCTITYQLPDPIPDVPIVQLEAECGSNNIIQLSHKREEEPKF